MSFYRLLGFRRIGASYCFGLATDADHQARKIPGAADFDPAEADVEKEDPDAGIAVDLTSEGIFGDENNSSRELKRLQTLLPLHHAAIALPDEECVDFYDKYKEDHASEDWTQSDSHHQNVLHIAACKCKVKSVQWLLNNVDDGQVLSSARTVDGYTPLEQLESFLETKRTVREHGMMICISDQFQGYDGKAVQCLAALRGYANPTAIQLSRIKYGCTCGECITGFLSPKMKSALLCAAEEIHDMLNDDINDGELWYLIKQHSTGHVAPDIQRNFRTNKSLRQGFSNIFKHAAEVLQSNKIPNARNLLVNWEESNEWPPVTKNFYRRGGKPENAIPRIFELAMDDDRWAGHWHDAPLDDETAKLPKCRNDHEYGCVALACGVSDMRGLGLLSQDGG